MSVHIDSLLLDTLSQCLQRTSKNTLWLVDENISMDVINGVPPRENLYCLSNRFDIALALRQRDFHTSLSDFDFNDLATVEFANVVYRVSKERPVVNHCINAAAEKLSIDGQLHLIGQKEDGINTHGKNAEKVFATKAKKLKSSTSYRFTCSKSFTDERPPSSLEAKNYPMLRECVQDDFSFISKPGQYGWNKIDKGSAILAREAKRLYAQHSGSVLDLGCGYGYLLLATKQIAFSRRCATDNNVAAVHSAEANFQKHHLDVQIWLDDCGAHINERFDLILCNPPFHQGFDTSSAISQKFISSIRRLLEPKGKALLVVNQFVPIEKLAQSQFGSIATICEERGFKVYELA
ncbi:MAG: methyltransferase [Pseudohongiellaceae bacterium]|nr:methyltransferase [Pseudohongiellaceae bacterium]